MMSQLTPREHVCTAFRFEPTPRVPRQLWSLTWAKQHYPESRAESQSTFPDDIGTPPLNLPPMKMVRGDPYVVGTYIDEWGCEFVNLHPGVVGEVKNPLVRGYATDLDKVRPPREYLAIDVDNVNRACAASDRFMLLTTPIRPFERMQFLRGTENVYIDLLAQPAGLAALRDRVHEWDFAVIDSWCRTDADRLAWMDDWGSQQGLLIHPDLWRALFKPLYAEYARRIHAAGMFAFMHSDGHIMDISEDLIEIRVDAVNGQLFCMDIEEIGQRFQGRITFWREIDRQQILPFGTVEKTRQAVRRVARALHDGRGGIIAQCEFGPAAKPENVRAVFDEWEAISTVGAGGAAVRHDGDA